MKFLTISSTFTATLFLLITATLSWPSQKPPSELSQRALTTQASAAASAVELSQKIEAHGRKSCGGFRSTSPRSECDAEEICVNDPFRPGCGMECDAPGICVKRRPMCGGFAGIQCGDAKAQCADDPSDDCDPRNGGADCAGVCVSPPLVRYEGQIDEQPWRE